MTTKTLSSTRLLSPRFTEPGPHLRRLAEEGTLLTAKHSWWVYLTDAQPNSDFGKHTRELGPYHLPSLLVDRGLDGLSDIVTVAFDPILIDGPVVTFSMSALQVMSLPRAGEEEWGHVMTAYYVPQLISNTYQQIASEALTFFYSDIEPA